MSQPDRIDQTYWKLDKTLRFGQQNNLLVAPEAVSMSIPAHVPGVIGAIKGSICHPCGICNPQMAINMLPNMDTAMTDLAVSRRTSLYGEGDPLPVPQNCPLRTQDVAIYFRIAEKIAHFNAELVDRQGPETASTT